MGYFAFTLSFSSNIDGLLKEAAFINGKWIHSTKTFDVYNPFDGNLIAKVPNLGEVECEEAIDAAYEVKDDSKEFLKILISLLLNYEPMNIFYYNVGVSNMALDNG